MMNLATSILAGMAGAALIASTAFAQTSADQTAEFYQFLEDAFEENTLASPISLMQQGRIERMDEWGDFSDQATFDQAARTTRHLETLHAFDFEALPRAAQVSYRIFESQGEQTLRQAEFYRQNYPISQMFMFPLGVNALLGNQHPMGDLDQAQAFVTRVERLEGVFEQIAHNITDRTEFGVIPPHFLYPQVSEGVGGLLPLSTADASDQHPLYLIFSGRLEALDIADEDKTRLLAELRAAIEGPVARGYQVIIDAANAAAPLATSSDGVWRHPNGEAYYAMLAENYTESGMTPAEIHDFGLAEVARIETQMLEIVDEVGFEGTLDEFREHLLTSPEFDYPDTDEAREFFLEEARAAMARVMAAAPEYFNTLPQAALEVRRIEPYREASAPRAFYNRPAPDGTRPGIFWANLRTMALWNRFDMEALVFHEAAPGHHFQLALMLELGDVPTFQNFLFFTAYAEGWGLYAERLADEMGLYSTPYSRFGGLNAEIWRAVRLVVDTGIHYHRWNEEQAIAYMLAHTTLGEEVVVSEVRRYLGAPGQALSYKMGMTRILTLRAQAQEALGDNFDIRAFHDVVIGNGGVPLSVLDELVADYIAENS